MLFVQNVSSQVFYRDLTTTLYQIFNSAIPVKNVKWIGTVKLITNDDIGTALCNYNGAIEWLNHRKIIHGPSMVSFLIFIVFLKLFFNH